MNVESTRTVEHKLSGDRLLARVKELIREGNVRRIIIKNEEGKTLIEIPLTVGVVGALLVPVWAAIGAIGALVANCSIEVEREPKEKAAATPGARPSPRDEIWRIPEEERLQDDQC